MLDMGNEAFKLNNLMIYALNTFEEDIHLERGRIKKIKIKFSRAICIIHFPKTFFFHILKLYIFLDNPSISPGTN